MKVVGSGWHDTYIRWDVSTPERVVAKLTALPGQGDFNLGRKLFATKQRLGGWDHLLGPKHSLVSWAVDTPKHGLIRRLEVQAHLGPDGENDLCPPDDFTEAWLALRTRMAMYDVLPVTEPRVTRCDPAVDLAFDDPTDGKLLLDALRGARWPRGWYAEWAGAPPYTTVNVKRDTTTIACVYCRNTKLRNGGERYGKLRLEARQRFRTWQVARPVDELAIPAAAALYWGAVFGVGQVAGTVKRLGREVQTVKLIERVVLGEISTTQYEQLTAYLDAERLGLVDSAYSRDTARRRRLLCKQLGVTAADVLDEYPEFDADLDEILSVPRSAFAAA